MATAEEMKEFNANQRHISCMDSGHAAFIALQCYQLEDRDKTYLQAIAFQSGSNGWLNYMFHDQNQRLLWIHGDKEVKLTYLASDFKDGLQFDDADYLAHHAAFELLRNTGYGFHFDQEQVAVSYRGNNVDVVSFDANSDLSQADQIQALRKAVLEAAYDNEEEQDKDTNPAPGI